ncbi:MAG: hypothetical protein R6V83_09560 [Candidatus Thorarchaeota archaeon]
MAKTIVLLGPPKSGKTFFKTAFSIALEKEGWGHLTRILPSLGHIVDYALAEQTPPYQGNKVPEYHELELRDGTSVELIEVTTPIEMNKRAVKRFKDFIGKAHCLILFFRSIERVNRVTADDVGVTEERKYMEHEVMDQAKFMQPLLLNELKPWWKFWRRMNRLMVVTTLWKGDALGALQFEQDVAEAMPQAMRYLGKRGVTYSFHTLDFLRDDGGVAIEEVEPLIPQIVRAVE